MSKCFISYRHTKPDEELAQFLEKFLRDHNHNVFIDKQMQVGTKWQKEIEIQLRSSEYFIILLSKESILSDMVRQEVKSAYDLSQKRGEKFTILPIRVDFTGELPMDLAAYLNPIQYTMWKEGDDFGIIAKQILVAIETHESLPIKGKDVDEYVSLAEMQSLFDATDAIGAPLPAADPRMIPIVEMDTGTLKLDSPFYVKRKADEEIMGQIRKHGSTVIVKGPRQMGKSSLLVRAFADAKKNQMQSLFIDFQNIDQAQLSSIENLLKYLSRKIWREFKTPINPDEYWEESFGVKENFNGFIQDALLKEAQSPVVILMDEVDRLFSQSYRDDFFATIRGWHTLRAIEDCWNCLNVVITHSTEPSLWIQDINQSPFNVGYPIRLKDFDFQQVTELNAKHGSPLKKDHEIEELIILTGGQPYLVRQAFYILVKSQYSISKLKEKAIEDRGPFGDHLRRFIWYLQSEKGLKDSLRQVLRRGSCDYETHFFRLKAAGLVKGDTKHSVQMKCQLYEDYFGKNL